MAHADRPILDVRGLRKSFGANEVLRGIDFRLREREMAFIIGPSGSGKSTFLRCCNRLEEPTDGSIHVDGTDILAHGVDINAVRRRIGMVFQSFNLYPHMTALGNVTLALRLASGKSRGEADAIGPQPRCDPQAHDIGEAVAARRAVAGRLLGGGPDEALPIPVVELPGCEASQPRGLRRGKTPGQDSAEFHGCNSKNVSTDGSFSSFSAPPATPAVQSFRRLPEVRMVFCLLLALAAPPTPAASPKPSRRLVVDARTPAPPIYSPAWRHRPGTCCRPPTLRATR